jgi:HEAT repeat protein
LSKWTADELLSFLDNPEFNIIYDECIYGLGLLGDPRAIEPMFALLRKGNINAAHSLKRLAPKRLRETLLELLTDWKRVPFIVHAAAGILAEFRDERTVPLLIEIIRDEDPELEFLTNYLGGDIAQFGEAGFRALVDQLQQKSQVIRRRAAGALMYTNHRDSRDVCDRLVSDPDPRIRELAEMALQVLPPRRAHRSR